MTECRSCDDPHRRREGACATAPRARPSRPRWTCWCATAQALDAERLCDVRNVAGTTTQPSPVKARLVAEGGWDKAFSVINLDCDEDAADPADGACRPASCSTASGRTRWASCPTRRSSSSCRPTPRRSRRARGVNILATCTPYQVGQPPGARRALRLDGVLGRRLRQLGARRAHQLRGRRLHRRREPDRAHPVLGQPPRREPARHAPGRVDTPVDVVPGLGPARLLRRRRRAGGPPGGHRRRTRCRPDRPQALRRGRGVVGRRRDVPRRRRHAGGADAWTPRSAAGRCPSRSRYGEAERRADLRKAQRPGQRHRRRLRAARLPARVARPDPRRRPGPRRPPAARRHRAVDHDAARAARRSPSATATPTSSRPPAAGCSPTPARPCRAPRPTGTRVFATDSAKQAHYLPAILGIQAWFGTTAECVDAAVTGRWRGDRS